jgi:hypothetical protein
MASAARLRAPSARIFAPLIWLRITGIALGWIGFTTALGAVVRKP